MRGAVLPISQYVFMERCSVKTQGKLYIYLMFLPISLFSNFFPISFLKLHLHFSLTSTLIKLPHSPFLFLLQFYFQFSVTLSCSHMIHSYSSYLIPPNSFPVSSRNVVYFPYTSVSILLQHFFLNPFAVPFNTAFFFVAYSFFCCSLYTYFSSMPTVI